jgi:LysM repeat protein
MTTGTPVYPGQRLVIPKYSYSQPAPAPHASQPMTAPLTTGSVRQPRPLAAQGQVHTVAPGETIFSIARRYSLSPVALAQANRLPPHHKLRMGEQLTIPGTGARALAPQPAPVVQRQAAVATMPPAQRIAERHAGSDRAGQGRERRASHVGRRSGLPLAGARPRDRGLRPEADRAAE